MEKSIVLDGQDAFEVFSRWSGKDFVPMVNEMVSMVGVDETVHTIKALYEKQGHVLPRAFVLSLRNAIQFIIDNQSKNN